MIEDESCKPVSPTLRLTTWLLICAVFAIVASSYLTKIEIVARGQGKSVPIGRIQVVQSQSDGKIIEILVVEGQTVEVGTLLVRMDPSMAEGQRKRIEALIEQRNQEITVATSIVTRLISINPVSEDFVRSGRENFSRDRAMATRAADIGTLVEATLFELQDQILAIDAQLRGIARRQETQQARLNKARVHHETSRQRFSASDMLRRQGTISKYEYLTRLREHQAIEADVLIAERELAGLVAEAEVMAKQRASAISTALSRYQKQWSDATISLHGLEAELRSTQNHLENLSLRSPTRGKVENLSVFTLGGFVKAGATLMSIVPSGREIEVEAFFDNRDIGFLRSGQNASIKFDSFPAERYGFVRGHVVSVGADARKDVVSNRWVYAVRLKLDRRRIRAEDREIEFVAGMTATIDVITGERRLISYFFEPIFRALQDSFGER